MNENTWVDLWWVDMDVIKNLKKKVTKYKTCNQISHGGHKVVSVHEG
jgi:hypothetical protein